MCTLDKRNTIHWNDWKSKLQKIIITSCLMIIRMGLPCREQHARTAEHSRSYVSHCVKVDCICARLIRDIDTLKIVVKGPLFSKTALRTSEHIQSYFIVYSPYPSCLQYTGVNSIRGTQHFWKTYFHDHFLQRVSNAEITLNVQYWILSFSRSCWFLIKSVIWKHFHLIFQLHSSFKKWLPTQRVQFLVDFFVTV